MKRRSVFPHKTKRQSHQHDVTIYIDSCSTSSAFKSHQTRFVSIFKYIYSLKHIAIYFAAHYLKAQTAVRSVVICFFSLMTPEGNKLKIGILVCETCWFTTNSIALKHFLYDVQTIFLQWNQECMPITEKLTALESEGINISVLLYCMMADN